jgi:hypothetical protein
MSIEIQDKGNIPRDIPRLRMRKIVARKFIDERKLARPEIINPIMITSTATGDRLIKEVLKGGYKVQPVAPPNSEVVERITHTKDNSKR